MKQATCKRCCDKMICLVLIMLIVFSSAPLYRVYANNENDYAVWQVMNAVGEVNPSGMVSPDTPYVDVRIRLIQTTPFGNGTIQLVINTDETVLVNPRRSPRVERSSLTPEQQVTYDMLMNSGLPPETVWASFTQAQGTNAPLHDMEWPSLIAGPPGWNVGQIVIRLEPVDSARGAWDGYGMFVDVRFDIIATAPTVTPITFDLHVGGHAGTWPAAHPGTAESPRPGPGPNGDFGNPPNRRDRQINGEVTILPTDAAAHVVNFSANGGVLTADGGSRIENDGESLGVNMPADPTRTGYLFVGWQTIEGDTFTPATTVNESKIVYAQWDISTAIYTVTFDANGGVTAANDVSRTVLSGQMLDDNMPDNPTRNGYIFNGWYTAATGVGVEFNSATVVIGDVTVFARWSAIQQIDDVTPPPLEQEELPDVDDFSYTPSNNNGSTRLITLIRFTMRNYLKDISRQGLWWGVRSVSFVPNGSLTRVDFGIEL